MILVDTGPLVALFDPADAWHARCTERLKDITEPLCTTAPVLTEAFHLLTPASLGSRRLKDFISESGLECWFFDPSSLARAFELMVKYADVSMDLADASLLVAAERLGARKVFTIDRGDFGIYRIRQGHRQFAFEVLS